MITKDNVTVREAFEASAFLRRLSYSKEAVTFLNQSFKEQVSPEVLQKWAASIADVTRAARPVQAPPKLNQRKSKYDIGST